MSAKHLRDKLVSRWATLRIFGIGAICAICLILVGGTAAGSSSPAWFSSVYRQAMEAPLPPRAPHSAFHNDAKSTAIFPAGQNLLDPRGDIGIFSLLGRMNEGQNAFFQSLGTNGRTCVTCHDPASAMGMSAAEIQARFTSTSGTDPIFAPVDGAVCPDANLPTGNFSLLLKRGVFRIFLPWPPVAADGSTITPEFSIQVVSDPTQCETDPTFGLNSATPMISVYRRPGMSANLDFVTGISTPIDPATGLTQPIDPATGLPESGNIMWDGREPTMESQAIDATLGHAQALAPPTAAQVQQIVNFETNIFSAQSRRNNAWWLNDNGGLGGPRVLAGQTAGTQNAVAFDEFAAWATTSLAASRQSIARGEAIFNTRSFTISNVAGFNDVPGVGNAVAGTCSTCHSQAHGGTDAFPNAQRDLGVAGDSPAAFSAPDLPQFQLTCLNGATTSFNGIVVMTRDPGKAILTGKCADIGKFTVPQLRGLAARAPYFHDGSAATIANVINFYVKRFGILLSTQDRTDLANFLLSL